MSRRRSSKRSTARPSDVLRALRAFRPALQGMRWLIVAGVALALAVTVLELLRPWPITWILDHLVASSSTEAPIALGPVFVFAGVAFAVPVVSGFAAERLQLVVARVSRKATVRLRGQVFEHVHRLDHAHRSKQFAGDLVVRLMGDVNMVRDLLFPSWLTLLSQGSLLVGGLVVFGLVDWRLLNVALVPLPLLLVNVERTSSSVKAAATKQRRKEGLVAARAAESIAQSALVKAFAAEQRVADDFRGDARSAERATMAAARQAARMTRTTEVLTGAGVALVLVAGSLRVRSGELSPGELVLAVSYTRMIYKPLRKLTAEGARLAKATACAMRVLDLLEQPVEDARSGVPVDSLDGDIEISNVDHRYPDGRRSLQGFSERIPAGSLVVVTGENGTGKSTLLSLLLRLHRPQCGVIRVGGRSIDDFRLDDYRRCIAVVPQQLQLFSGTIRSNILFGRPDATDDEVLAAARDALLLPVLEALPDGLDTELDEHGTSLSGGQARRVMLARAAIRDASLVLLDEPLAGLDPEARDTVIEAIRHIAHGRTTVVVHHGDVAAFSPDRHIDLDRPRSFARPAAADLIVAGR